MSCWYDISGTITVRDCPEVKELVDGWDWGEINLDAAEKSDGNINLTFSGGSYMSNGGPVEIDEAIMEFAPFTTAVGFFDWNHDNAERGRMYVGPPELSVGWHSSEAMREIGPLIPQLTPEDRAMLKAML